MWRSPFPSYLEFGPEDEGEEGARDEAPSVYENLLPMGSRVRVDGYEGKGVVRFVGKHHISGEPRVGVSVLRGLMALLGGGGRRDGPLPLAVSPSLGVGAQ